MLPVLIASSALAAQGEAKFERPQGPLPSIPRCEPAPEPAAPSRPAPPGAAPRLGQKPDGGPAGALLPPAHELVFDRTADALWVSGERYKVAFEERGPTFVPFLGAAAARSWPATFRLTRVTVGAKELALASKPPELCGSRVGYDRGALAERYDVRDDGIEQSFAFESLPVRGELVVHLEVESELELAPSDGGFDLAGPEGGVRYGRAIAFDARGARSEVESRAVAGGIELRVPGAFVAGAALPLVIDPLIGSWTLVATESRVLTGTDLCWSELENGWALCWERVFSQTDSDVYVRRLSDTLQGVGSTIPIDVSTASWRAPRIAGLRADRAFLVVAEASGNNASPVRVAGRTIRLGSSLTVSAPFDIAGPGLAGQPLGDCIHPDVGGDPGDSPVRFTVVWERARSAADHDIEMRQVRADATFVNPLPTPIDTTTAFSHHPVISKSNGAYPYASQGWAIVYRRDDPGSGLGHVRGSIVNWNGDVHLVSGTVTFPITGITPRFDGGCDVSSPTDAALGRRYLVTETRRNPQDDTTGIHATVFDRDGANVVPTTVLVERGRTPGLDAHSPVVDSDGCRFAVCHVYEWSAAPRDDDVRVLTLGVVGSSLAVHDAATPGYTSFVEGAPAIAARRGGGGGPTTYGIAHIESTAVDSYKVAVRDYRGFDTYGGITVRPTGCGSVAVAASGTPALGLPFSVTASGAGTLFGILVGLPIDVPVPGCNGCVLGVSGNAHAGTHFQVVVPCDAALTGVTVAFQGFAVGGGTCLGALGLSDTLDVRVQ